MKKNGTYTNGKGGRASQSNWVGMALIGVGVLILLSNMGILAGFGGIAGLLVLGVMGGFILNQYYSGGRQHMWMLIAGFILLGAAAATVTGKFAGAWFLAFAGMGFFTTWREKDSRWWALIPAGTLFTLSAVVLSDVFLTWLNGGAVFFAGLALTFVSLYLLPRHSQPWALVPAAGSALLALVVLGSAGGWVMPILLIMAGLYLISHERGRPLITINWEHTSGASRPRSGAGTSSGAPSSAPDSAAASTVAGAEPSEPVERNDARATPYGLPEQSATAGPRIPDGWSDPDANGNGDSPRRD